ncbi:MAG: ATP-binding protein [Cyanobacteria bacterium J06638_7]
MSASPARDLDCLEIRAEALELRRASSWLRAWSDSLALPAGQIERLEVCLNEVLANLLEHGGDPVASQPIALRLEVIPTAAGRGVRLLVSDGGVPFNPVAASDKALPASLAEASPGGLGLRLVRAYCDAMGYRVLGDRNELSIEMHWSPQS